VKAFLGGSLVFALIELFMVLFSYI
jgi:hypothetical protein